MSMVCTTPYRAPVVKPPIEVNIWPRFGVGRIESYLSLPQMNATFATEHADPQNKPTFAMPAVGDEIYFYYMAPVEYGAVTFRDQSGLVGGWDGASWPLDDMGEEMGPVEVTFQGRRWNLYRTDWGGNRAATYTVGFANG